MGNVNRARIRYVGSEFVFGKPRAADRATTAPTAEAARRKGRLGVPVTDCVWREDHWSQGGWARPQPPNKTRASAAAYPGTDMPWLSYQILGTQAREYEAPLRSRSGQSWSGADVGCA